MSVGSVTTTLVVDAVSDSVGTRNDRVARSPGSASPSTCTCAEAGAATTMTAPTASAAAAPAIAPMRVRAW